MMQVIWFKMAIADLVALRNHIALDDPQAARAVVSNIKRSVRLLRQNPALGRPGRVPGTRERVIDKAPYILPYRVRDNRIEILRVLHTSRQWPKDL